MQKITIKTEYITLGQMLKIADLIGSGGEAKFFLMNHKVFVNDELDDRRGRKLYENDEVKIDNVIYKISR